MTQEVGRRSLITERLDRSQESPCGICGGQSGTGSGISARTSVFPCQYSSMLHVRSFIHSFIDHPHCKINNCQHHLNNKVKERHLQTVCRMLVNYLSNQDAPSFSVQSLLLM